MHINDALDLLIPSKNITVDLDVWTKDGSIMHMKGVVAIKADFENGLHKMRFVNNPFIIREIRDYCIFRINDEEVYI